MDTETASTNDEGRESCRTCGRTFATSALARHKGICLKTSKKKRNVFDSAKQRAFGDELTYQHIKKAQRAPDIRPNKNWRATHEHLVSSFQNARDTQTAIARGAPLPPPPAPTHNPDYVQCNTCNRRFNQTAAARHIPFCVEQQKRLPRQTTIPKKSTTASRLEYKVPTPKAKIVAEAPSSSNGRGRTNVKPALPSPTATQFQSGTSSQTSAQRKGRQYGTNNSATPTTPNSGTHELSRLNGRQYSNSRVTSPPTPAGRYHQNGDMDCGDGLYQEPRKTGSGRLLRTGKTPQMYEDARREVKLGRAPRRAKNMTPPGGFADSPIQQTRRGSDSVHAQETGYMSDNLQPTTLTSPPPKFCHDCGTKYPIMAAKFCCECGVRRIILY